MPKAAGDITSPCSLQQSSKWSGHLTTCCAVQGQPGYNVAASAAAAAGAESAPAQRQAARADAEADVAAATAAVGGVRAAEMAAASDAPVSGGVQMNVAERQH